MKKTKLITMAVSFLLTVGMIGAGFASWIISSDVAKEETGKIKVEEVIDSRLKLAVFTNNEQTVDGKTWTLAGNDTAWNADLRFGIPKEQPTLSEGKTPWLTHSAYNVVDDPNTTEVNEKTVAIAAAQEDLVINVGFVFDSANLATLKSANFTSIDLTVEIIMPTTAPNVSDAEKYPNGAEDANYKADKALYDKYQAVFRYITKPEFKQTNELSIANIESNLQQLVEFKFGWFADFSEKNPYEYFNSKGANDTCYVLNGVEVSSNTENAKSTTYADYAKEVLTALLGVKDLEFTIKVTAVLK
jgi:hypothetical protein